MERYRMHAGEAPGRRTPAGKPKAARPAPGRALRRQYGGLMALLLAGAAFGAAYGGVFSAGTAGRGFFLQSILTADAASMGFFRLSAVSFFPIALLLCAGCLFGFCAVGLPFEIALPALLGGYIGVGMSGIYRAYGAKGLGICAVFLLPQAVLSALSILAASREGIRFSASVGAAVFHAGPAPSIEQVRAFCVKYAACFAIVAAASGVQAASVLLFAKLFFAA